MNDDLKTIRVLSRPKTIEVLGVSERTFERLEAAGDVPPKTRLSEGRVGYRVSDIEEWLERRRVAGSWQQIGDVVRVVASDVETRRHK